MSDNIFSQLNVATEEAVAELRGRKITALRNERAKGDGPPWIRFGKTVLYPLDGLREYLAANTVTPERSPPTLIHGKPRRRQPQKAA